MQWDKLLTFVLLQSWWILQNLLRVCLADEIPGHGRADIFLVVNEAERMSTISFHPAQMQGPHASQIQGNHFLIGCIILNLKDAGPTEGICQARNPMEEHKGSPESSARFVHVTGHLPTGDSST